MSEPEEQGPTESEVLEHMGVVAHRVAKAIAEGLPESERAAGIAAAERVLLDDEGARELLAAAFAEGRADALRGALRRGEVPDAPDWSDVESVGERRAIAREENICATCSASDVCAIAAAIRHVEALVVLRRCDRHR
jgi:hypothetical protein